MNRAYRLVWSAASQSYVPAPESARGRGKKSSVVRSGILASAIAAASAFAGPGAGILPSGGQVTAGSASVTSSANILTVQQSTQRAAINWQTFSIGSGATVNFVQPNASAIALNRVVGNEQSVISGALNANGQVFILNANGVLFTKGAEVNVGGLVASTLSLSDTDFMAGRHHFTGTGSRAGVINLGTLNAADGGYVALLGNQVRNEGVVTARLGSAILAAGDRVSLNFNGDSLVGVTVDHGTLDSLVENKQAIRADGGLVVLTAKGLDTVLSGLVNNSGEIRAQTVTNREGRILLLGDMDSGTVKVGGTLDASAPAGGRGGFIETSAAHVRIADDIKIETAAVQGPAGRWLIDPVDFTIAASGGDITGTTLSTLLGANNVTIQTATGTDSATHRFGTTGGNGDIFVNDIVSWSANKLTLNAHRNILINADLNGSGTASLALEYGQGAVAAANTATYSLNNGAKVSLPAGQNFSTKLGSDGVTTVYTVVTSLGSAGSTNATELQGIDAHRWGDYVLGADIDASATATWNSNAGFKPIIDGARNFDGLGHTISNLHINRPSDTNVGLFGYLSRASVRNVGLLNVSIAGQNSVGGLVGNLQSGTISGSYATGALIAGNYGRGVGGLVGLSANSTIIGSYAQVDVTAGNNAYYVGGLAGSSYGIISDSHAAGTVTAGNKSRALGGLAGISSGSITGSYAMTQVTAGDDSSHVGGLVGMSTGPIRNSYAVATVTTGSHIYAVGGLVGSNNLHAIISNSHVTGSVTTGDDSQSVGGLAGENFNVINDSHANTTVKVGARGSAVGGLVGYNDNAISGSYATGSVTAGGDSGGVGGLVGDNYGSIGDSYAATSVTAKSGSAWVGGLAGVSYSYSYGDVVFNASINNCHAQGTITAGDDVYFVGGLVGGNYRGSISNSHAVVNITTGTGGRGIAGLAGYNDGFILNSHAAGLAFAGRGSADIGGLVGGSRGGTISNAYHNVKILTPPDDTFVNVLAGTIGFATATRHIAQEGGATPTIPNSLVGMVDGGVRLPPGVEQQMLIVEADNQ